MLDQRTLPAVTPITGRAPAAAFAMALLGVLAALALRFPQYLTTPTLRGILEGPWTRGALLAAVAAGGALALIALLRPNGRRLSATALVLTGLSAASLVHTPVGATAAPSELYVGLDWFLIDLLGSAVVFISLERAFTLRRNQPVLRSRWATDLGYFAVNHCAAGLILLVANGLAAHVFDRVVSPPLQDIAGSLPMWIAVPLILLLADLVQYWLHRAYHASPILWRIHRVHHSVETMDWLAGSRQHFLELVLTRALGLAPLIALGFDKASLDVAIAVAMLQAVLNHANVEWPRNGSRIAFLRFVFVTPHFHHWHHAREGADNSNFAALFSFIDHLFGTAIDRHGQWPVRYGIEDAEPRMRPAHGARANAVASMGGPVQASPE